MSRFNQLTAPHLVEAEKTIREFASEIRQKITDGANQEEIAGWANKAARARRIINGTADTADKTAIATEAHIRGRSESPTILAQKQVANEGAYAQAIAAIDGYQSSALKQIEDVGAFEIDELLEKLKAQAVPLISQIIKS